MSEKVQEVAERITEHLKEIAEFFNPGVHITLVVRTPGNDEADFVLSSELDLGNAMDALERRKKAH